MFHLVYFHYRNILCFFYYGSSASIIKNLFKRLFLASGEERIRRNPLMRRMGDLVGGHMRRIDPSKKEIIAEYIDKHFCENDEIPSVRDIVEGTGIPLSTVHRYLISMREDGALDYSGRRTARTKLMEDAAPIHALQVLGTVACGPGQEEEQRFIEYIRMPESLVEKGDYFALIAKGESMIGAGIFPGDYVFVKRQQTANEGDLVIALFDGKNNLKKLGFDQKNKKYILHSCNPNTEMYPDIIVGELQIQGVVKGSYHKH